jgi:fused signal recognition particle receptor
LFNRFKEKLSGFKDALSSKILEKAAKAEEKTETQNDSKNESSEQPTTSSGTADIAAAKQTAATGKTAVLDTPKARAEEAKPKGKFSFLEKAKTLVFEQEVFLDEKDLEEPMGALEMALLESDVALPVAEEIVKEVKAELVGAKKKIGADTGKLAEDALRGALINILSQNYLDFDLFVQKANKPVRILFVGVNGTGKTTSIAKVAKYLMDHSYSVVLAAGDTFRAGAIEQLEVHADKLGIKVVKHKTGGDPAAVIFDAIEYSKAHNKDIVLADTAGRLHTNINLMDQMRKIVRVTKPDLLIFVDEAIAGNDAVERARLFNESVPIDGSILTKTDADAKGGSAISIAYITGKPVLFLGVGQGYPDLVKFEPHWLVDRLMGEAEA